MKPENLSQPEPTFEERMAFYAEKIEELKKKISLIDKLSKKKTSAKQDFFNFSVYWDFNAVEDYTEFIAVLAFFEEYELLNRFLEALKMHPKHDGGEKFDMLNTHVRPQFAYWEPTPLYFITSKKAREKMKDPCKMLRFLAEHGANVNQPAGDGSTPLWNQTNFNGSAEILQTLLELGADPNQISIEGRSRFAPLAFCLLPNVDENEENKFFPYDALIIKKAKLLLEHGANPNLAISSLPNFPPLIMAIQHGFPQDRKEDDPLSPDVLELIELLLQHSANPNFTDSEGCTPLVLATETHLPEVAQLLLSYGAETPEENKEPAKWLQATEDCYFRPGGGEAWEESKSFTKDEILNSEADTFSTDCFKIIISEKTPLSLKGKIIFEHGNLELDAGEFTLDTENPVHHTEYLNVAYDTHLRLTLQLEVDLVDKYPIEKLISLFEKRGAMVPSPASDEDIVSCNTCLTNLDFPELPDDYIAFLKICGGYAFDSVELYGPNIATDPETDFQLRDIVSSTEDFNSHYLDGGYLGIDYPLLCLGRRNGDYFTYDPTIRKYQLRDHESACTDVLGGFDTFQELFVFEVVNWTGLAEEEDDDDESDETTGASERYIEYINEHILPFIDYDQLQASYQTDMVYAKGVLNRLHEAIITVYGGEQINENDGDEGFVMVPGILRGMSSGNMCIALFSLDLSSGGELWSTYYLCADGLVSQDNAGEINSFYIPYNYCYTVIIPADFHVKKDHLPDEIKSVLADFRNHHVDLLHNEDAEQFEEPGLELDTIIRQYNYKLEIGTVGTDDENIASVLYNINRMEMKASFTSSDVQDLDDALNELFFMITDAKVHFSRFLKIFGDKIDTHTVGVVVAAFDDAMQMVRDAGSDQTDTAKMSTVFSKVYEKLLDIVPSVLVLDAQAAGRG